MASVRPANARLAPTRMEALHGLEVFAVHVGLAELQFVGSAHGRVQAAGEDGRRETVLAVVGHRDGFVEVAERGDRQSRPEYLLAHDCHLLATADQHRWLVVVAAPAIVALAANSDLGAIFHGLLYGRLHAAQLRMAD